MRIPFGPISFASRARRAAYSEASIVGCCARSGVAARTARRSINLAISRRIGRYRNAVNYLAPLLLAEQTAESLIGNLAGDFVKGRIGEDVPPKIAEGIRHHRRVDAFTDSHPSVAAFRRVLI